MKDRMTNELSEWSVTALRVGTGIVFLLHDGEELLVQGFSVLTVLECLCGAALILGLFTRLVSVVLALGMVMDVLAIHFPESFLRPGVMFEFALLWLSATAALVLAGPGRVALDNKRARRKARTI